MNRAELALMACDGMSDDELVMRGKGAFAGMIHRKRKYADAARKIATVAEAMSIKIKELEEELLLAKQVIADLDALSAPVNDLSEANIILSNLFKSG